MKDGADRLAAVEAWSPPAFVAGGLLSIGSIQVAILDIPGFTLISAIGGLLLVVGVAGVASEVAARAPWLVLAGGAATATAGLAFTIDAVITIAALLAGTPATPLQSAGGPDPLTVAYWTLGVALLLAGVGGIRTGVTPRPVGLLLVVASLSVPGVNVVEHLLFEVPGWVVLPGFATFAVALILVGVRQDAERVVADGWVPPSPVTADGGTAGGWTNDHVRDGYDVDGAESRTGPFRMATWLQVHRVSYELFGSVWGARARSLDSVRRWFGRLLNREAAVEQAIAEREYLLATVKATDRGGVGSLYWRLGMNSVVGIVLVVYFGLWWVVVTIGSVAGALAGLVLVAGGLAVLASVARAITQLAEQP